MSNGFLQVLVKMTLEVGLMLNDARGKSIKGFQIRTLLKLFDLKSTIKKEKSIYHVMLKSLLLKNFPKSDLQAWRHLQVAIFDKD